MAVATDLHRTFLILARRGESVMTADCRVPHRTAFIDFVDLSLSDSIIIAHRAAFVKRRKRKTATSRHKAAKFYHTRRPPS